MPLGQKMWSRQKILFLVVLCFFKIQICFYQKMAIIFQKAKGCHIWDLQNKKYLDMSFMGVGTNIWLC